MVIKKIKRIIDHWKTDNDNDKVKKSQIESLINDKDESAFQTNLSQLLMEYGFDVNPCDAKEFNYFVKYPFDPTKYIVCDPWGEKFFFHFFYLKT